MFLHQGKQLLLFSHPESFRVKSCWLPWHVSCSVSLSDPISFISGKDTSFTVCLFFFKAPQFKVTSRNLNSQISGLGVHACVCVCWGGQSQPSVHVHDLMCPQSDVSKALCVHDLMCQRPAVSMHHYTAHFVWLHQFISVWNDISVLRKAHITL